LIDGKLTLSIPLSEGGTKLLARARSISYIANDCLNIVIPDWLAKKLKIVEGTRVGVDDRDGRFNVTLI
jgi:hypothetical protein